MLILVINSGSSSLKYQVRELNSPEESGELLTSGLIERIGVLGSEIPDHRAALEELAGVLEKRLDGRQIEAAGHRVVHGGEKFSAPVLIDRSVVEEIDRLSALAPLHNPSAVQGLEAMMEKWPDIPQVAVFDTAFHQTMPPEAYHYAVPREWYQTHRIRRYGFHGTSHDLITAATAELIGVPRQEFNGIVLHLGNGASATAISEGRSIDTSMGFTPLAGLVMGTRTGDLDPSLVTHIMRVLGVSATDLDRMMNKESGLLGVAGASDMRQVVEAAEHGSEEAELALNIASYRLAKYVGGYHVAVGGAQAITFTAGIGENSAAFRARVLDRLAPLGVKYDHKYNLIRSEHPRLISTDDSAIKVAIIPTNEELAIAQQTLQLIS